MPRLLIYVGHDPFITLRKYNMAKKEEAVEKLAELTEDEGKSKIIVIPTPMPAGGGRITRHALIRRGCSLAGT